MARRNLRLHRRPASALLVLALVVNGLVLGSSIPSAAAEVQVRMNDNFFAPQEIRIDLGDTVTWQNAGFKSHTVTSDTGLFDSGARAPGQTFSRTFRKEGTFFYHCRLHGKKGQIGMWGVVVVGKPQEKPPTSQRLHVPGDFQMIQQAVDSANPGSVIVVDPGVYSEEVTVTTPGITIRGVDRFRTVLRGDGTRQNGITIGASDVTIKNLTVRDYREAGIFVDASADYTVRRVDAIKNRTYGIYASGSHGGVIARSFVWGSGDSGIRVDSCRHCGTLIDNVHAEFNFLGYSGTNASGIVVRDSTWVNNGAGIAPNSLAGTSSPPSEGIFIYNNVVQANNYRTVPAAGISTEFGIPFGTGIWLTGVSHSVIRENDIAGHQRYGVLITDAIDGSGLSSVNSTINFNTVGGSGLYDLAWDGSGSDDCFSANAITGATGPSDIQTTYACEMRPFAGTTFDPVNDDVDQAVIVDPQREQQEPPEPQRPRCQRRTPGCA